MQVPRPTPLDSLAADVPRSDVGNQRDLSSLQGKDQADTMRTAEEQMRWAEEIEARKKIRNAEQLRKEEQARYDKIPKLLRIFHRKPKKEGES